MVLRIDTLSKNEITTLNKIVGYDRRSRWRTRARILLLANDGYTSPAIAKRLGCHPSTARRWLTRWNQDELLALKRADCIVDQQQSQKRCRAMRLLMQQTPSHLDLPFSTWSCRTMAAFLRKVFGFNWTFQQVWYYLKKAGLRYRKVEERFVFKPPNYDLWKAAKRLLDRFLPDNTLLLYLDEKGPCQVKRYAGHCWSQTRLQMDVRQAIHGKMHLFGAYDPQADRIWLIPMDNKDSGEFCEALTKLWVQLTHRPWKHLLIIMDNASYHRSTYTQNFLSGLPNCNVLFLPTYSPELNPIEQRFRQYSKEVLELGTFSSKADILEATSAWERYYNTLRSQIFPSGGDSQVLV